MDKIPVPVGKGLHLSLVKADGSEKRLTVTRGGLCQDWFKYAIREDGHMDLYQAEERGDPRHGGPQIYDLTDLAKDAGWDWPKAAIPTGPAEAE